MSKEPLEGDRVVVQVLPVDDGGQQIGSVDEVVYERLTQRAGDLSSAIPLGVRTVADGLGRLDDPDGWAVREVTVGYSVALTAGGTIIAARLSAGATLEVTVTFARRGA